MNRQRGLSLISTLVGLLLAILSALAVMTLFRTVIQISVLAKGYATQDSVVSSGMLTAQMEIQKAGFGIESAKANSELVWLLIEKFGNIELSGTTPVPMSGRLIGTPRTIAAVTPAREDPLVPKALVWRWIETDATGTHHLCAGLLAFRGGLRSLRPTTCTAATDWATTDWTSVDLIPEGRFFEEFPDVKTEGCWPFSKSPSVPAVLLIMKASNSSKDLNTIQTVCLPNISQ